MRAVIMSLASVAAAGAVFTSSEARAATVGGEGQLIGYRIETVEGHVLCDNPEVTRVEPGDGYLGSDEITGYLWCSYGDDLEIVTVRGEGTLEGFAVMPALEETEVVACINPVLTGRVIRCDTPTDSFLLDRITGPRMVKTESLHGDQSIGFRPVPALGRFRRPEIEPLQRLNVADEPARAAAGKELTGTPEPELAWVRENGTLEAYQVQTADGEVLCAHPSVEHVNNPFAGSGRAPDAIGWIWCRWAGGDYVDDPTDDVTTTGEGRMINYAVLVADSDLLEVACFDPIARGKTIVCDRLQSGDFFPYLSEVQAKDDDEYFQSLDEGNYSSPFGTRTPEAVAQGLPLGWGIPGFGPPLPPPPPDCEIGNALLHVERSSDFDHVAEPALEGATFSVTDYGENVRIRYNAPSGDHRTVGVRVARLTSFGRSIFVARAFNAGTPAVIDISFERVSDVGDGVEWLTEGTPLLRDDQGRPIRAGSPVYSVRSGPLAGFDLVLTGCKS